MYPFFLSQRFSNGKQLKMKHRKWIMDSCQRRYSPLLSMDAAGLQRQGAEWLIILRLNDAAIEHNGSLALSFILLGTGFILSQEDAIALLGEENIEVYHQVFQPLEMTCMITYVTLFSVLIYIYNICTCSLKMCSAQPNEWQQNLLFLQSRIRPHPGQHLHYLTLTSSRSFCLLSTSFVREDILSHISFLTSADMSYRLHMMKRNPHLFSQPGGVIIGFHFLGPNAGEVTQGFAIAMKYV